MHAVHADNDASDRICALASAHRRPSYLRVGTTLVCAALLVTACGGGGGPSGSTTYQVGGTVSGLIGSVVLQNGADHLTVTSNGVFTFPTQAHGGDAYAVTVQTQPAGQRCTVVSGSGVVSAAITGVTVSCAAAYHIGGSVSGLTSGASVVLLDNAGDPLTISGNGSFTFATALPAGGSYQVTVGTYPAHELCTVTGGYATVPGNDVSSVSVICQAALRVGGTVRGLSSGASTSLLDNGGDSLTVAANGSFLFPTPLLDGSAYAVTVGSHPPHQLCSVNLGAGVLSGSDVSGVIVSCQPALRVNVTISGLAAGKTLRIVDNGVDPLTIGASGTYSFGTPLLSGGPYAVTVAQQPIDELCTVTGGSGTVGTADISVSVGCVAAFKVGGTLAGLASGTVVLQNNGTDALTLSANGTFQFATALTPGSTYTVTLSAQPPQQSCSVSGGGGTVSSSDITTIVVRCPYVQTLYSFGSSSSNDGSGPETAVRLGANGNLFGTAVSGGTVWVNTANNIGAGTFFELTPTGTETVLWNFGAGSDGQNPSGDPVVDSGGNWYGVTYAGGASGDGIVYRISATGQETVLWNFGAGADGAKPFGNLLWGQDGNLYGTTQVGGSHGGGTVFRLTLTGAETVLWNFGGGSDGQIIHTQLIQATDGNFYGTTEAGGTLGFGTVFRLTPGGVETVLYNFTYGATDGEDPLGVTQGPDGALYGVTAGGGTYMAGTAFRITLTGSYSQLYSFGSDSDARGPAAALLLGSDGDFYGATDSDGLYGLGTVFRLTPQGAETVLWRFADEHAGYSPFSTLTQGADGTIYGTTYRGGTATQNGYGGTVFKLVL